MTNTFSQQLDSALKEHIRATLERYKDGEPLPESCDFIPDSFGALVERLAIEHTRAWNLGDAIGLALKRNDKDAVVELNKKLDACFKVMRPRLVEAINRKADEAILHGRSLVEDSVKLYKGYEKEN